MKISVEHGHIERRLKLAWKNSLKSDPRSLKKSREMKDYGDLNSQGQISMIILRMIAWACAFMTFPQSWMYFALFATWMTAYRALLLLGRGGEEWIVALYGADDTGILNLSRRWLRAVAWWGGVDALVFLGIWYVTGRIPLWALVLGIPTYVLGTMTGPRLFASVLPRVFLSAICAVGGLWLFASAIILRWSFLSDTTANAVIWMSGALSPSGWSILMVRDLLSGHLILLALLPLLLSTAFMMKSIARIQEARLLNSVCGARSDAQSFEIRDPDDELEIYEGESTEKTSLPGELAEFSNRNLLDYSSAFRHEDRIRLPFVAGIFGIVLVLALITKYELLLSDKSGKFFFFLILLAICVLWLPLTGIPSLMSLTKLSPNRMVPAFVLFPFSFRKLLKSQIKRDISKALRVSPLLLVLNTAALMIVVPLELANGLFTAFYVMVFLLFKLPWHWSSVAMHPLSSWPLHPLHILRWVSICAMSLLFLAELIIAILVFQPHVNIASLLIFTLCEIALGIINGGFAALTICACVSAYEKRTSDIVKPPPKEA